MARYGYSRRRGGGFGGMKARLMIALLMAAFALGSYFMSTRVEVNPVTGEKQRISLTTEEEIKMGLAAREQMAKQHGGLHASDQAQALVDQVGNRLVQSTAAADSNYNFEFHLLADPTTVNAFALPGGQIFITAALFKRLPTEDSLAGVLGHEIGHVVGRHSAQQIAKAKLTQGLTTAVILGGSGGHGGMQMSRLIGQLVNTKYGREDELESDDLGVRFMLKAGYNPEALMDVMRVLEEAAGGKGGARPPEFMSTHPSPDNRVALIKAAIDKYRAMGL